jgi:uncharacterized protein (DUF2164 family)
MTSPRSFETLYRDANVVNDFLEFSKYKYLVSTLQAALKQVLATFGQDSTEYKLVERALNIAYYHKYSEIDSILKQIKDLFSLHFAAYYNQGHKASKSIVSHIVEPIAIVALFSFEANFSPNSSPTEVPYLLTLEGAALTAGVLAPINLIRGVLCGVVIRGKVRAALRRTGIHLSTITDNLHFEEKFSQVEDQFDIEHFVSYVSRVLKPKIDRGINDIEHRLENINETIASIEQSIQRIQSLQGDISDPEFSRHLAEAKLRLKHFNDERIELKQSLTSFHQVRRTLNAKVTIYTDKLTMSRYNTEGLSDGHLVQASIEVMSGEIEELFLNAEAALDARTCTRGGDGDVDYRGAQLTAEINALRIQSEVNSSNALDPASPIIDSHPATEAETVGIQCEIAQEVNV